MINRALLDPTRFNCHPCRYMSWITITSEQDATLEATITARVQAKINAARFSARDVEYVSKLKRPLLDRTLNLPDTRLEKLRRLCQLWDLEIRPAKITSHRKFVGPLIVGFKKLLFPVLKVLLKDLVIQQREFNASAISLMAELSNEEPPKDRDRLREI